jgi:hypothetical protein
LKRTEKIILKRSSLRALARRRGYDVILFSIVLLVTFALLLGTLSSMRGRSLKGINLESEEDTGASTNLGTITFDGVPYSLPDEISKTIGTYSTEYFAYSGHLFDHWETTGLVSVSDPNANPTNVTVSGDGTLKPVYAAHHSDHLHNDYAPMVIPVNGKKVTVAPTITCTTLEDDVYKPHYHPCKLAQTLLVDDDWSDKDANYTYLFEDWTDDDWNDVVLSLYAVINDNIINVEICLEDREADWKNPLSVELTPESLTIDIYWNSTDYPGDHVVHVNPDETVDIELFDESNPGDIAFIKIITPSTYTLTITSSSGGTTDPQLGVHSYEEGTVVNVTANPKTSYVFDHWVLDGEDAGSDNLISVAMDKDHNLHAVFREASSPPPPVGGHAMPIDNPHLLVPKIDLTPRIGIASVLMVAMAATIILIRRRNNSSRRES